jgi:hypothetical protein
LVENHDALRTLEQSPTWTILTFNDTRYLSAARTICVAHKVTQSIMA